MKLIWNARKDEYIFRYKCNFKLYHKEDGTDNLYKLIEKNREDLILTITDISKVEFYSVFYKNVREGNIELIKALEVFELFKTDLKSYNVVDINTSIKDFSIELLHKYGSKNSLRTLDSMQLAGAIFFNQLLKVDIFISSDKRLLNIAKEYFFIFNPED